jgi:hypothetical protein
LRSLEESNNEVSADAPGLYDSAWGEPDWHSMIGRLVEEGIVTWREVATTILGELNPGQVGTGIASADVSKFGFKKNHATLHPGESFMPYVMQWLYAESGRCIVCGTRLDLQADHIRGRESFANPTDADWLGNMALRCRRHNVAKRKSHLARAGRTLLPAQQALMWILYEIRPTSKRDLARLCRLYGMTMSSIRFDEAWAMAVWLEREGRYKIATAADFFDVLLWPDNAVTRRFTSSEPAHEGVQILATSVPGDAVLGFVSTRNGIVKPSQYYTELPLSDVPFAYELGDRPITDIAIWPTQHSRTPMPPRGDVLHAWTVRSPDEHVVLQALGQPEQVMEQSTFSGTYFRGRRIKLKSTGNVTLTVKR